MNLPDGRSVVPDNRFDLVPGSVHLPTVSVVIPYYDQPRQLDLVLAAIAIQDYPRGAIDVVIADDGSSVPPAVEEWTTHLSVSTVRQDDRGFRAAAARNLGAAASKGAILCFLDADTVPASDYLRRAVALPSVIPDAVVVGRRKHADLTAVHSDTLNDWMKHNAVQKDSNQDEPAWLVDAYSRTGNLARPGWDGYKYVISAVLTCSRELFDAVGGFDESFVRYGGEDWEFANRAFMMGAVFAHEPDALAWHDGPDWAGREVAERTERKNDEAIALAPLITDPAARTAGLRYRVPDLVARVRTEGHSPASLVQTLASILQRGDCAVWLAGENAESIHERLALLDSRVRTGTPDLSILSRCRFVADVAGRVQCPGGSLDALVRGLGPSRAGGVIVEFDDPDSSVTIWTSRAIHRARRWSEALGVDELVLREKLFGVISVQGADAGLTATADEPWLSW